MFAEQTEEHPALVVMFKEVNEIFCDSIGLVNGTSGDVSTFDGYSNTVAMYNSYVEETGKGSPLAMKMMDFHENGQSDFIPSVAEQRLLVATARQINPIIREIRRHTDCLERRLLVLDFYGSYRERRATGMALFCCKWWNTANT